jgi:hypothetical protein
MTDSHNKVFDYCDVFVPRLEGEDPAVLDIFANENGQRAFQALFPDLPITWFSPEEYDLGFVPPGWGWATLNVRKMAELSKSHKLDKVHSDPDASMNIWLYRLGASLHRDGVRVIVADDTRGYRIVMDDVA